MPDARKSLQTLSDEWRTCTKCSLGERRVAVNGEYVAGEGPGRGVLFVGEGPGKDEEVSGRPFIGASGKLLRRILENLSFEDYYITNLVSCRSCSAITNADGTPRFLENKRGGPPRQMWKDEPPSGAQVSACLPRLYEEIYIVDPVIIVALGVKACEALLHRSITGSKARGTVMSIFVPGVWTKAVKTETLGAWFHKVHGVMVAPTVQNMVEYSMMPTVHPAAALRDAKDQHERSLTGQLISHIKEAVEVYNRYMLEVFNVEPMHTEPPEVVEEVVPDPTDDEDEDEERTEVE